MLEPSYAIANPAQLNELLLLLQRLDQLLERAIAAAQVAYGPEAATNPYRGLHISEEEVERLLSREPGTPVLQVQGETSQEFPSDVVQKDSPLGWLQQTFGLSAFDIDIVAIAFAPELDLRYERLYSYLQDDVTRKLPTVDLALNLLCPNATTKLARRRHFAPDAPLLYYRLVHLIPDANQVKPSQLAQYLKLDEQVLYWLLGQSGINRQLQPVSQLIKPTLCWQQIPIKEEIQQSIIAKSQQLPQYLYFYGSRNLCQQAAQALAQSVNALLLSVNLTQILDQKIDLAEILRLAFREAQFKSAVLYLEGVEVLGTDEDSFPLQQFLVALRERGGWGTRGPHGVGIRGDGDAGEYKVITILAGRKLWKLAATGILGATCYHFPVPEVGQRQAYWKTTLAQAGIELDAQDLFTLANRFRLTPEQIGNAITLACNNRGIGERSGIDEFGINSQSENLNLKSLYGAARAQSGYDLAGLARKIEPKYSWEDIVLLPNSLSLLKEICNQVKHQQRVYADWGFSEKLGLGKGLNALFSGSPGTGKTMAAEVIAQELQLDLYKIDLSQVVSKYIGETEKNLDRIFTAAENANAILLFDEADALFGKRSEVKDAHDRYANIEIGYLLQKMEEYEGIAILTTNLRSNMDDAFLRRLRFIVEFPLPSREERRRIWQKIWPKNTPRNPDLDLEFLAQKLEITGANIRNIALAAAFFAADDGQVVQMSHLMRAVRREYQKIGKLLSFEELGEYGHLT